MKKPTCQCADAVNKKVDDGTFRQALSRHSTIPAAAQDSLVGRASRKRYLRGRYVDDVRQVLERQHWPEDEIDVLLYRSKHTHERGEHVAAVSESEERVSAQTVTAPAPKRTKPAARTVEQTTGRTCFMIVNPLCGFAAEHRIFCAALDVRYEKGHTTGWVSCEENAEQHVHTGQNCMNCCARHAERYKKRGAQIDVISYLTKNGKAKGASA